MLSRIARGLYELGRHVERAQNMARILEVNHKMNLERASIERPNVWHAISEAFACGLDDPTEEAVYDALVLSATNPHSVRHCVSTARDEGRAMRDHISEEMWLHLNQMHLGLGDLSFQGIVELGRSEFNRQVEVFADAFHGLADDTMIRGESWSFLRVGKLCERALAVCQILEIKRKSLSPGTEGAPIDVHQWQALLRSLSGYEPYRRAYDARIVPEQVLEFVIQRPDFPRSLVCTLSGLAVALETVEGSSTVQLSLSRAVGRLLDDLRILDASDLLRSSSFDAELRTIARRCGGVVDQLELGYFISLRPEAVPIRAVPGAALVPQ